MVSKVRVDILNIAVPHHYVNNMWGMAMQSDSKFSSVLDDISLWTRSIESAARAACKAAADEEPDTAGHKIWLVNAYSDELRKSLKELDSLIQTGFRTILQK